MSPGLLHRHALVYCAADRLSASTVRTMHERDLPLIEEWIAEGHPLVARMRRQDDPSDEVALGLPLPLDCGKKRIALTIAPSMVAHVEAPPLLRDVAAVLLGGWRDRLSTLSDNLALCTEDVRVVGSLAWQFLTGKSYLHPRSDIDLVVSVSSGHGLQTALEILAQSDRSDGHRIDGEIVMTDGEAVSWRELCGSSKDLLVKTLDGPRICPRHRWLNKFQANAA